MFSKILQSILEKTKRFLLIWGVILFSNQLVIFGACFAPYCLAAALPHTLVLAALVNFFAFRNQDSAPKTPAQLPPRPHRSRKLYKVIPLTAFTMLMVFALWDKNHGDGARNVAGSTTAPVAEGDTYRQAGGQAPASKAARRTSGATDPLVLDASDSVRLEEAAAASNCGAHYYKGGAPVIKNPKLDNRTTSLCMHGADLKYSAITYTALWSAEHITADKLVRASTLDFYPQAHPEERLPASERTELGDYGLSQYSMVRLTSPFRFATVDGRIDNASYANVVPLAGSKMQRRWQELGELVADRARRSGSVYAISGTLFEGEGLVILNDKVLVPTSLYIAFYDQRENVAGAYVLENRADGRIEALPLTALEARAAIDLFPALPPAVKAAHTPLPRL